MEKIIEKELDNKAKYKRLNNITKNDFDYEILLERIDMLESKLDNDNTDNITNKTSLKGILKRLDDIERVLSRRKINGFKENSKET